MNGTSKLAQVVFSILSALFTTFTTALNFIIPCFLVIMLDVFTAWMLQRRVHKRHPERSDGKFKSEYKFRIIITLILVFVLLILGAYVDMLIIKTGDYAVRFAAGMFLFYEKLVIGKRKQICQGIATHHGRQGGTAFQR